jgi:peptidase M28-like protein
MGRLLTLLGALIIAAWIAWWSEQLPSPRPASAPATEFSAERAMADVRLLAPAPHPIGSPQNMRVRDALVGRMAALGLSPQVRPGVGVQVSRFTADTVLAAPVDNVVGVLPGRDRKAPAVLLMAHYDSVPGSAGAADDIMGVAASLEVVRAIKSRGVPARDVMVLFTDGEEAGLLGANHFFRRDQLARRVGLTFNLEARGAGGRTQMFQTSAQNGELIDLFRQTARRPASSSLAVFIYDKMPNDTDLTETLHAGVAGFNYAIAGRQFDYHSPTATPANLDRGSLQDMGDQVLSAADEASSASALPGKAPDAVYNSLFGDVVLAYPGWVGWIVLAATGGLLALSVRWARQAAAFPVTDLLRGMGGLLFAVLGSVAVLQFMRHLTGAQVGYLEQRFLLAQVTRWELAVMLTGLGVLLIAATELARGRRAAALLAVLAGVGCSAFGGLDVVGAVSGILAALIALVAFGRAPSRQGAWAGVLILGLILAIVVQVLAPTAAYIVAWPLFIATIGAAATSLGLRPGLLPMLLLGVLAAVTLGWLGGFAHTSFISLDLMPLMAAPVLLAAFVVWPLAHADARSPGPFVALLVLMAGAGVTLTVRSADPWSPRHPKVSYVAYQLDQDTGRAWRFGSAKDRSAWSDQVLEAEGGQIVQREHWSWRAPMIAAPARPIVEAAPTTGLTRQPDGSLTLSATPPSGAQTLVLQLRANTTARIDRLAGVATDVKLPPGKWARVYWSSGQPLNLGIKPAGPGRLDVRYTTNLGRWPAAATPLPPRPADLMAWGESDSTFVTGTRAYAW